MSNSLYSILTSDHLLNKLVDKFLSIAKSTETLGKLVSLDLKPSEWGRKFEWPQEIVGFLEFWSACDNFVDEVFNTVNSVLSKLSSNDAVISEWNSPSINLTITSLVNEFLNGGS